MNVMEAKNDLKKGDMDLVRGILRERIRRTEKGRYGSQRWVYPNCEEGGGLRLYSHMNMPEEKTD